MIASIAASDEISTEAAGEGASPPVGEPAPPPLTEVNARIEALAAEIRATRAVSDASPSPRPTEPIVEAASATKAIPEPAPAVPGGSAPRFEPRRLGLIPFVAVEPTGQASGPAARKSWAPKSLLSLAAGKRLQIGALAASLAAIGLIGTAALHERSNQAHILAIQSAENQSLTTNLKILKARIDALEAAKSRDDTADLRKTIGEMKASVAGARDTTANLAQLATRFDKGQHDLDARFAKLTEKIDHDSASRAAEITARLEKLEKKPAAPVVAALPPPVAPAPAPTTLPRQAEALPAPAPMAPKETTGSIARPRPMLRDWIVRDVHNGIAMVESRDGEREVSPGDFLPGAGRVERIERRGRDWAVVTNLGTIFGDGGAQF